MALFSVYSDQGNVERNFHWIVLALYVSMAGSEAVAASEDAESYVEEAKCRKGFGRGRRSSDTVFSRSSSR